MSLIQGVFEKANEVLRITADLLAQAASSLIGSANKKAESLPLTEISKRFNAAVRELRGTDASTSAAQSPVRGAYKQVGGHRAVSGKISVNDQELDTLLSEGSFNRKRKEQIAYAESLGYRLATREEHRAYVKSLLEKEVLGTINRAERGALATHRKRYVRDTQGGLAVSDEIRDDSSNEYWNDIASRHYGALFVRASAKSK